MSIDYYRITYTFSDGSAWSLKFNGTKRQAYAHVMRTKNCSRRDGNPVVAHTVVEEASA